MLCYLRHILLLGVIFSSTQLLGGPEDFATANPSSNLEVVRNVAGVTPAMSRDFTFDSTPTVLPAPTNGDRSALAANEVANRTNELATAGNNYNSAVSALDETTKLRALYDTELARLDAELKKDPSNEQLIDQRERTLSDMGKLDEKIKDLTRRRDRFANDIVQASDRVAQARNAQAQLAQGQNCGGAGGCGAGGGGGGRGGHSHGGGGGGGLGLALVAGLAAGAAVGALAAAGGGGDDGGSANAEAERARRERERQEEEAAQAQQDQAQLQAINLQDAKVAEEIEAQNQQTAQLIQLTLSSSGNSSQGSSSAGSSNNRAAICFTADRQRVKCSSLLAVFCYSRSNQRVECVGSIN